MADNIILNAGAGGDTIRADDNAGIKTLVSKIEIGEDGTFSGLVGLTNPFPIAVTNTANAIVKVGDATNNAIRVNIVDVNDAPADFSGSGSINALDGAVTLSNLQGVSSLAFTLAGTWVATVSVDASLDGTNWFSIRFLDITSPNSPSAKVTTTTNGDYLATVAGYSHVRVRASAYTSGTITVAMRASTGSGSGFMVDLIASVQTVKVVDQSGDNVGDDTNNALRTVLPLVTFTDDSAFAVTTDKVLSVGALYQNAAPAPVGTGEIALLRMTSNRAMYVSLRDAAGNERGVNIDAQNNMGVTLKDSAGDSAMDDTNNAVRVNIVAGGGAGGTSSNFGSAFPSAGTAVGFNDGTNMQGARVFDTDSGAGSQYVVGVNLRLTASGGSVEFGTNTNPIRVDPTGTTKQPVSVQVDATPANGIARQEDTAHANNDIGVPVWGVRKDTQAALSSDGNYTPLQMDSLGNLRTVTLAALRTDKIYDGNVALTPKFAFANIAASQTDANIITGVTSKKLRIHQIFGLAGGAATNLTFNSKGAGTGVAISPLMANAANGGEVLPFSPMGWFETAASEALTVTTGAGSTTGILVGYTEV